MRILFSESLPDYENYVFPYAVWAVPEENEEISLMFGGGFLPAGHDMNKFYLCRHIRIKLENFQPSSENRRILRKGEDIICRLVQRQDFDFTQDRSDFCLNYFREKFGPEVMTRQRFHSLIHSDITSHILVFEDQSSGKEIGYVTLFLYEKKLLLSINSFLGFGSKIRSFFKA